MESSVWQASSVLTVGQTVKRLRGKAGLTILQLSKLSGVDKEQISRIERGKDEPHARTVERLAKALKVDATDIVGIPADTPRVTTDANQAEVARKSRGAPTVTVQAGVLTSSHAPAPESGGHQQEGQSMDDFGDIGRNIINGLPRDKRAEALNELWAWAKRQPIHYGDPPPAGRAVYEKRKG